MLDSIFCKECIENLVAEVAPFITYGTWCSKLGEDILFEELKHHLGIVGQGCNSFSPLAHVIHGEKDVQLSKGRWKWPHKIDSPKIKNLDLHNVV